jgi:hypothetical protein
VIIYWLRVLWNIKKHVIFYSQPEKAQPPPQPVAEPDIVQGPSPVHRQTIGKAPVKAEKGQHRRPKGKKDVPK